MLNLSVVVPVRNAEAIIEDCLKSVFACRPREVIVVDGESTDATADLVRRYPVTLVSDEGKGLPVARALGARLASSPFVALVDADVVLPEDGLASLLAEFQEGGYVGLQAGLYSTGGPGYWGAALAEHHRSGRSKHWFGLVATIFRREDLLASGFDSSFRSGEDIELRWRLQREGARVGVSSRTTVTHRFADDSFAFARDQWLADGEGLARMTQKHRWRGLALLSLPAAAACRGVVLSLFRGEGKWIPYYVLYAAFNYVGMLRAIEWRRSRRAQLRAGDGVIGSTWGA